MKDIYGNKNIRTLLNKCAYCSIDFNSYIGAKRKFCSRKCYELSKRKYTICNICNTEYRNSKNTKFCSKKCFGVYSSTIPRRKGYSLSEDHKRKIAEAQKGNKANNWRGGVTPAQKLERKKPEYAIWRKLIFERDNYTCVICFKKGGNLQADHIKSWIKYPELRLNLDNGRTLCINCHKKTPTYARNLKYQI